jgi:aspartate aminotransferase-like enzyme
MANVGRYHLLTPGPVPVPEFVQQALQRPVIPHRSAEFEAFYAELLSGLRYLFQTEGAVGSLISSGTGGVESLMYSLIQPGEEVVVVENGKFSQRWALHARQLGASPRVLQKPWGQSASPSEITEALQALNEPRALVLTHCETSTGALLDLEEIAFAVREAFPEVLILVDAITTVGAQAFYFDAWGIDGAVAASQKALMNPAGISVFALSERARARLRDTHPGDYQNLLNYLSWAEKNNYPYTPPVSLLYGLQAALASLQDQRLPVVWNQTQAAARSFRNGLARLGGELLPEAPSFSLTAFSFPDRSAADLLKDLKAQGFWLSGGQGPLKGKILRVSHMGPLAGEGVMEELLQAMGRR